MSADFEIVFLGTGTSIGVPVIGCGCEVCISDDPRNKRLRSSILVKSPGGIFVVDTGPDFRQQCLREGITHLDAALFTHAHSDHIMGFDDLRRFTVMEHESLDVYATRACMGRLTDAFGYAFDGQNRYWGYLKPRPHLIERAFTVCGWRVLPLPVQHGKVETIGFHFEWEDGPRFAYIPDAKVLETPTREAIRNIPLLILDGLQMKPHATHLSIPEAVEVAADSGAGRTWLTHFSCRVNYRKIQPELPDNVQLAWDGLHLDTISGRPITGVPCAPPAPAAG